MKGVESNMDRKINLPVTWSVCGIVEIGLKYEMVLFHIL